MNILAAENRILKAQVERAACSSRTPSEHTLGEIGHRLGRKVLGEGGQCGSAGHHLGLVPQARGPQIRVVRRPVEAPAGLGSRGRLSC